MSRLVICTGSWILCSRYNFVASIRDAFPEDQRAKVLAKREAAFAIAPRLESFIGSFVDQRCGLPTNFLVLILLAVVLFIFFWWSLPETNLYPNRQALNSKIIFRNHYSTLKDPYFVPYLIVTDLFIVEVYSSVTGFGKPSDYPIAEVFQPRI